jgi:hypothetical protein
MPTPLRIGCQSIMPPLDVGMQAQRRHIPWPTASSRSVLCWGISVAARSAMASTVALVLAEGIIGITEASAIRSPLTPLTRSAGSTTACSSVPMRRVPTGWK